jgi:hypothetical protein
VLEEPPELGFPHHFYPSLLLLPFWVDDFRLVEYVLHIFSKSLKCIEDIFQNSHKKVHALKVDR